MKIQILESTLRQAINDVENHTKDGKINWSFVDADCYMECRALFRNDADYYGAYDDLADKVFDEVVRIEERYPQLNITNPITGKAI